MGTNDNQAIDSLQITEETRAILRDWKQKMCSSLESVKSEINGIKQELMNIPVDVADIDTRRITLESRLFKLEAEEKWIESCMQVVYHDISPMQKLVTMPDFRSLIASMNAKSIGWVPSEGRRQILVPVKYSLNKKVFNLNILIDTLLVTSILTSFEYVQCYTTERIFLFLFWFLLLLIF